MVSSQKIFLFSFIVAAGLAYAVPEGSQTESYLAEKPRKAVRGGMSKARNEAIIGLESLAHDLTTEIHAITELLHDIMWSTRGVAEGNAHNKFTNALYKDKENTLKKLKAAQQNTVSRTRDLKALAEEFKR